MHQDDIKAIFDRQANSYDQRQQKTAPIRSCMYLLLDSLLAELPHDAHILCVGAGTGEELARLAAANPGWIFTAVEPSGPMLDVCRQRASAEGFADRCHFHEGYLDSLKTTAQYDAATCFLVSQFILDEHARSEFFGEIAARLKPGGLLASADLSADVNSAAYDVLLHAWVRMTTGGEVSDEAIERMRNAYANDVGVLPPERVASIIEAGGFTPPVLFFHANLIHAWISKRA